MVSFCNETCIPSNKNQVLRSFLGHGRIFHHSILPIKLVAIDTQVSHLYVSNTCQALFFLIKSIEVLMNTN